MSSETTGRIVLNSRPHGPEIGSGRSRPETRAISKQEFLCHISSLKKTRTPTSPFQNCLQAARILFNQYPILETKNIRRKYNADCYKLEGP